MNAGLDPAICRHCGQPSIRPQMVELPDGRHPVCCHGCAAAASTIHGLGLGDYYRFRSDSGAPPPTDSEADLVVFGMAELVGPFLSARDGVSELTLRVDGLRCAACVWLIERALKTLPGVRQVTLALATAQLRVSWRGGGTTPSTVARRLAQLGYRPRLPGSRAARDTREQRLLLARLVVAGLGAMQAMMYATALYLGGADGIEPVYETFFRIASFLVATPVVFFAGWPFLGGALAALRARAVNMDVPVALALVLGWSGSVWTTLSGGAHVYFESLSMLVFFLLISRWLEQHQRTRVTALFAGLQADMPLVVVLIDDGDRERPTPVHRLAAGDRLRLRQGDVVPVDGEVADGRALVQEAALTGEPVPLQRGPGDPVRAGSRLQEGWLVVRAAGRVDESRMAQIGALVARAQTGRFQPWPMLQRVAVLFVGTVLALAVVTLLWHWPGGAADAFEHALAVLVVTCPCALALAAPLTAAAMIGKGLERDVLIADPSRVLSLPEVHSILFDKTGTLTRGDFRVESVRLLGPDLDEQALLAVVAGLEQQATHPLARPLRELASPAPVSSPTLGREGVCGEFGGHRWRIGAGPAGGTAGTLVQLYRDGHAVLEITLADTLRDEAPAVLQALRETGRALHLASGDQAGAVAAVARALPLASWAAGLSPEDKRDSVQALRAQGPVLVVGDGVNDAPAFVAAEVAVAVAGSAALARDAASAYLLGGGLGALPWLFGLSHRARRVLRQNLAWAIGYNLVAVPFAMAGLVPPWLAAIGMSLSSLLITANAARLARWKS